MTRPRIMLLALALMGSILVGVPSAVQADSGFFLGSLSGIRTIASTVPANGDVNPYGVAVVPRTTGLLRAGNVLVSNFNNSSNLQGIGTSIVQIARNGTQTLFARIDAAALPEACPGGVGLTTALVVLRSGWVIVGSLPTSDGTAATAQAGCLLVLNSQGHVVETFAGGAINGPWDMTALDLGSQAFLFVTNVLNGTVAAQGQVVNRGTVVRLDLAIPAGQMPQMVSSTTIGSGFAERSDPAALVIGPTGVGLGAGDILYIADSLQNRIAAIPGATERTSSAGLGATVAQGGLLNDPLGVTMAPNGDVLSTNGNNGNILEITPAGQTVAVKRLDSTGSPPGAGTLFGLAITPGDMGLYFVDDGSNTLNLLGG